MSDQVVNHPAPDQPNDSTVDPSVTTVTTHFKLIFIGVLTITGAALLASIALGILIQDQTEASQSAASTVSTIAQMGFGAIVGLLGGRAA